MIEKKFVDFDMSFKRHPITGDIGTKLNAEAVKNSIKNIIRTAPYDRKFHPEISCRIKNILFRDISSITIRTMREMITESLTNNEPRIKINRVAVSANEDLTHYIIVVYFRIKNVPDPISVKTLLQRIR